MPILSAAAIACMSLAALDGDSAGRVSYYGLLCTAYPAAVVERAFDELAASRYITFPGMARSAAVLTAAGEKLLSAIRPPGDALEAGRALEGRGTAPSLRL